MGISAVKRERGARAVLLRLLTLGVVTAMSAAHPAGARPANGAEVTLRANVGDWTFKETHNEGDVRRCTIGGEADASTAIWLTTEAEHYPQALLGLANNDWSIKEGDDVGEVEIITDDKYRLTGKFATVEHGLVTWVDADAFQYFLRLAQGRFSITRNGETVGRYSSGNLAPMVTKLRECGSKLSALDPFAKPTPSVATPPRPINKDEWLRSIEKAYFTGPQARCILCIRKMERNSEPATVRFRIAVNEKGEKTGCEILASSGYADWREEFCRLTMASKLSFTPAVSNAGGPINGNYVDTAVVAFQSSH